MTQKQRALPAQTEALKYLILDVLKDEKIYHWHEVYRKIYKKFVYKNISLKILEKD